MSTEGQDRQPRFLSMQEIADDLGESVDTVRDWAQDGRLAPVYGLPNGKRKVRRDDYEEWLRTQVIDRRNPALAAVTPRR